MADQDSYILNTVKNGIQKVVLNRPTKKNALAIAMYEELTTLLNDSAKNEEVLMFVLTGNGSFFSSGNDIYDSVMKVDSSQAEELTYKKFIDALIMYPKLLVAVVNGPAIGIACTMLGLFDMVYASDKAYFSTPFSSLGLVAEGCSTYTFPQLLGRSKAGDMLYMGYKMSAHEAEQYGLVSKVYTHDSLEEVWNYLNMITELSFQSILDIKRLVNKWNKNILLKVNAEEAEEIRKRFNSPDVVERFLKFLTRKNKL